MKFLLSILLLFTLYVSAEEMAYQDDVEAQEAYTMVTEENALLLDVRDPVEFLYVGHAAGSVNVPVFFVRIGMPDVATRLKIAEVERKKGNAVHLKKTFVPMMDENKKFVEEVAKAVKNNKQRKIIVLCRSGERSAYAANRLAKNGFDNVYNLDEGYIFGWKAANLPSGGE